MTTGEGGMITTNDSCCDEFARSLRCHGIATGEDQKKNDRNALIRLGHNWRMTEIQALLGCFQLERLDKMIQKRQQVAQQYYEQLDAIDGVSVFNVDKAFKSSFYKFPIKLDSRFNVKKIRQQMQHTYRIGCGTIYYPPCHLQPFYMEKYGYKKGDFPIAEKVLSQTISLPIHPGLSEKNIQKITDALKDCLRENVNNRS
jgi:perosamine synthetase